MLILGAVKPRYAMLTEPKSYVKINLLVQGVCMKEFLWVLLGGALSIGGSLASQVFIYYRSIKEQATLIRRNKIERLVHLLTIELPRWLDDLRDNIHQEKSYRLSIDVDNEIRAILILYFPEFLADYQRLGDDINEWNTDLLSTIKNLPNQLTDEQRSELFIDMLQQKRIFLNQFLEMVKV